MIRLRTYGMWPRVTALTPLAFAAACPWPDEGGDDTVAETAAPEETGDPCLAKAFGPCADGGGGCQPDVCVKVGAGDMCVRPVLDDAACQALVECAPAPVAYDFGWCVIPCQSGVAVECPAGMACDPVERWCVWPE